MSSLHLKRAGAALAAVLAFSFPAFADEHEASAEAREIHQRVLVLDAHVDVLLPSTAQRYFLPDGGSRADLNRLTEGGVDAVVLAVATGPGPRDADGVAQARAEADEKLAIIRAFADDNPDQVGIALSPDDVERLREEGRIAVIIGFQNARILGDDVSGIDVFYDEGARVFAFTHAGHNDFADSSRPWNEDEAEHGGLSDAGRQAVARLNDLGALIDVSQLSEDAALETVELSRAPVVATHSNVRALVDNTRNLTDAEIDAIAQNGGVIHLTAFSAYLLAADREAVSEIRVRHGLEADYVSSGDGTGDFSEAERDAFYDDLSAIQPRASVSDYVDHIDYIVARVGWEHVGIGSDFDHGAGIDDFDSAAEAANLTAELLRRGYEEDQIAGIWGGNFLRAWRAAEAARADG